MKSGICPKCSAREVYRYMGKSAVNENIILTDGFFAKGAAPDKYICAACGYLEYYLSNAEGMELVRKHWEAI